MNKATMTTPTIDTRTRLLSVMRERERAAEEWA